MSAIDRRKSLYIVRLLVQRDLKVKYRGSALGFLWSILNPLVMMLVLSFVFSRVVRLGIEDYPLFVLSGILLWNVLAAAVPGGTHSIAANAPLMRKVPAPAWIFPAVSLSSAMMNFLFALVPYFALSFVFRHGVGVQAIQALPVLALYCVLIFGLVLGLSSVNVRFRDVGFMLDAIIQILFYGSAVLLPISSVPEDLRWLVLMNPLAVFIDSFRKALFHHTWIPLEAWCVMGLSAALAMGAGFFIYRSLKRDFPYHL
jgi:lipopolysaccharide transport system permease protein